MTRAEIADAHTRMISGASLAFFILAGICVYLPSFIRAIPQWRWMFGGYAEQASFLGGVGDMLIISSIGLIIPAIVIASGRDVFQG